MRMGSHEKSFRFGLKDDDDDDDVDSRPSHFLPHDY